MIYNLINSQNCVIPNYDLSNKDFSITYHYLLSDEVLVIGRIDGNYHFFEAKSALNDTEKINAIYNELMQDNHRYVREQTLHHLSNTYSGRLEPSYQPNYQNYWNTLSGLQIKQFDENSGYIFAYFLQHHHKVQLEKVQLRMLGSYYLEQLKVYQNYIESIDDYLLYETKIAPLRDILEQEQYLLLSKDEEILTTYSSCMEAISSLYNAYQTAIR